jgi:nicotinate phosphoribosyltransferase
VPAAATQTDLYQLTMAAAYFHRGLTDTRVTCEAFLRRLPPRRTFLVMAGTQRLIDYLANLAFTDEEIAYLRTVPALAAAMTPPFIEYLRRFRFTGDVWSAPEGSVVFADEPLVRVTAPIIEAQIVETTLLSILNHSIKVASKAARVVLAADGAGVIEFGGRRTHEDAAVDAARAAFVAGCVATSNVAAGMRWGIPIAGTLAHMFIMAHARPGLSHDEIERAAFASFVEVFPDRPTLLIDTWDSERGIDNAIAVAGEQLGGVRLDSGDILALSRSARQKLDTAGLTGTKILASSGLDEHTIAGLVAAGAPIDFYGVGENITEPVDAPITGVIYKLVANHRTGVSVAKKSSGGKSTRAGVKQAFRQADRDVVGLAEEEVPGEPLLEPAMAGGRTRPLLDVRAARARFQTQLRVLPERLRRIPIDPQATEPEPWPVVCTPRLEEETRSALVEAPA